MVSAGIEAISQELYAARIISRNLSSSLTFLTWDILITLDQEVAFIWMTPWKSWMIKTVYLFLRYYAFLTLMSLPYSSLPLAFAELIVRVSQAIASHLTHKIPIASHICHSIATFQLTSMGLIAIAADILLMIRVYALYNRSRWIAMTMATLFILEITATFLIIPHTLTKVQFDIFCSISYPKEVTIALGLATIISPLTTFFFVLAKMIQSFQEGWGNTSIMSLLVRDGTWGIMGFVVVWLINPLIGPIIGKSFAHVAHFWFMSIIPSIGCRMILNLQRLKLPTNTAPPFTTVVPIGSDSFEMISSNAEDLHPRPPCGQVEQSDQDEVEIYHYPCSNNITPAFAVFASN